MLTRKRAILICAGAVLVAAAVCIAVLVAMAGAKAPVSAAGSVVSQTTETPRVTARPSITPTPAKTAAASPSPTYAPPPVPQFSQPAPPVAESPVAKPAPAPAPARRLCPSGLVDAALASVSFSPYEYNDNKSVITVKGSVTNNTTAAVTINDNDVPNFSGLDTRGESIIIELYGKWDWTPPPGNARPNSITLAPGQQLTYTVSSTDNNSTINDVKYWFTAAALGSMEAVFDFNGPYWDCRRPLRNDGQGFSLRATNLPTVKQG
jgi:hypothetical protein